VDSGAGLRATLPGGHAVLDLGTLPGDVTSAAAGVNARGDIVGYSMQKWPQSSTTIHR
jgi:hypothetical protein